MYQVAIQEGSIEEVKKEVKKLQAIAKGIIKKRQAEVTAYRKDHPSRSISYEEIQVLLHLERVVVEMKKALPKYNRVPVQVSGPGGWVTIDWDFLQSFLRKLKGYHVQYTVVHEKELVITYRRIFGGELCGTFTMQAVGEEYAALQNVPRASEGL